MEGYDPAEKARATRLADAIPRERAAIETQVGNIEKELAMLGAVVDDLFGKFAPVLREVDDVRIANATDVETDNPSIGSSRLYATLRDHEATITRLRRQLITLRERAEV